ncbi:MAG TPA: hybrid sensor histidine kinase/response regulator [Bacteroidales bacterium]|nr:hybrid sensor histidine kinase/response regulator [Bacteroidales bacterium]
MNDKKNILVVDDNQINLQVVSNYLKESDYNVALAMNGPSALKILDSTEIELILMDIMMPEMDGFETTRKIKEHEHHKEIPIIFLTAKSQPKDIVKGFESGGVDYITKPFHGDELKKRVKNHVELYNAKKTILQYQKTRDRLYSILAHDIRSPLASISMLLDGITEKYIDTSGPHFDKLIREISLSTKDTLTLIQNILEWTKAQSNNLSITPETLSLKEILDHSIQSLTLNINEKKLQIICKIPPQMKIFADDITTQNIFRNIISNAIKFTPSGGTIEITYKESIGYIDVIVKDSGVGISPFVIEKIFKRDEHYTSKGTNNEKGTGLGLYMVKDFIKLNKGKLHVESELEKGTTFTISLPKAKLL